MSNSPENKYSPENKPLIIIFIVQIALFFALTSLFFVGLFNSNELLQIGDFWFAIMMGSLGSSIALAKKIKLDRPKFVEEANGLIILSTLMPIVYGSIMAGIAYLIFMSGILSGDGGQGLITANIFPNFDRSNLSTTGNFMQKFQDIKTTTVTDTGKLLVWCFITGYSEKFITGILNNMESRFSKS